jgi:hypothetical protein
LRHTCIVSKENERARETERERQRRERERERDQSERERERERQRERHAADRNCEGSFPLACPRPAIPAALAGAGVEEAPATRRSSNSII